MAESTEPRAVTAALSGPAFVTRNSVGAMHAANRHVERWAPEARPNRSLQNLGFVDRLVTPWLETAQRSAGLRMFGQLRETGFAQREGAAVSWVFPRPWYQDELDWMAAARHVTATSTTRQAPALLTTRGTFVAPQTRASTAMPAMLHEYVAPSLSVARQAPAADDRAYSPLVPFAAAQAAHAMARGIAPLGAAEAMSPGLRAVLATMLERASYAGQEPGVLGSLTRGRPPVAPMETRSASAAPQLETPPAPRPEWNEPVAARVAEEVAVQRARIAELQRVARAISEREAVARAAAPQPSQQPAPVAPVASETRPAPSVESAVAIASEQQRIEQRIAERLAERAAQVQRREVEERVAQATRAQTAARLHEQAREAASRDARMAAIAEAARVETRTPAPEPAAPVMPAELATALAALPPELVAHVGRRPERAVHAIHELGDALRAVELLARNAASGGTFEPARGPRLAMPAGLGGLVAMVDHTSARQREAIAPARPTTMPVRMPSTFVAAGRSAALPPALGATAAATPAAIQHVAWADRWLARFAGARPQSLDTLTLAAATPETRLAALAAAAPGSVYVSPEIAEPGASGLGPRASGEQVAPTTTGLEGRGATAMRKIDTSAMRIDDDAETPDEMLFAIAAAASQARAASASPEARGPRPEAHAGVVRETLADVLAHSAPAAPMAGMSAQLASSPFAPALRHLLPLAAAPTFDVRALFGGGLASAFLSGLIAPEAHEIASLPQLPAWAVASSAPSVIESPRDIEGWDPTYVAPELPLDATDAAEPTRGVALAPLTTLRSALLSWEVEHHAAETRVGAPSMTALTEAPLARSLIEAMALPMLGEATLGQPMVAPSGSPERAGAAFAAPGMIADRAQQWSVAQERSSADLSFDFVAPELVLAARVYGLGPAEAAQAARLAVAGPGQLSAMASAIDRTFVQAMQAQQASGIRHPASGSETPRSLARPFQTVYPTASGEVAGAVGQEFAPSTTTFGVEKRTPRGAFLWPSAAVAALGMTAPAPDGDQSMSVAALELLAAQSVAELGTYAALGESPAVTSSTTSASPKEEDVLESVTSMVPSSRKAKFEALYLALGQSEGRSWTPAARAARALALAGRGDEAVSARERASIAWDVLPNVLAGGIEGEHETAPASTGDAAVKMAQRRQALREAGFVEMRPGLGGLSARAGEALGSYVSPSAPSAAPAASARESGAMLRAPTASPELVQTGRSSARYGGGEVEIPSWFEAAAKKMFAERGSGSSVAEDISIAELTLIQSVPSSAVAASSRSMPSATPSPATEDARTAKEEHKIDIEKVAHDVMDHVKTLMDNARARNGEPHL
jgi:hypothetical protein